MDGKLIAMAGEPGRGKSFLADEVLEHRSFRSDVLRKELFDAKENLDYDKFEDMLTYSYLILAGIGGLENEDVALDATFSSEEKLNRFIGLSYLTNRPFEIVEVTCPEEIARERIRQRNGVSDAGSDLLDEYSFDTIPFIHYNIDNSGTKDDARKEIDRALNPERNPNWNEMAELLDTGNSDFKLQPEEDRLVLMDASGDRDFKYGIEIEGDYLKLETLETVESPENEIHYDALVIAEKLAGLNYTGSPGFREDESGNLVAEYGLSRVKAAAD